VAINSVSITNGETVRRKKVLGVTVY